MKIPVLCCAAMLLLVACSKKEHSQSLPHSNKRVSRPAALFTTYVIRKGEHFTANNILRFVDTDSLCFAVKFDSSAVYLNQDPANQEDINKLYGFSDNNEHHHRFSARIGWRWSNGALRLFGYVYNHGIVSTKELGVIPVDEAVPCAIYANKDSYTFKAGPYEDIIVRGSVTEKGKGYLLYPYFGGDEPAPHQITIQIQDRSRF